MRRDVDSAGQARFLQGFFWVLYPIIFVGALLWFFYLGITFWSVVLFVPFIVIMAGSLSLVMQWIVGGLVRAGETAAGRRSWRSLREQLAGDLERIKYMKRCGDFKDALKLADEVLEKDPEFPEALYLKSQVLWEGFEDRSGAAPILRRLIKSLPREEPLRRWVKEYYGQVCEAEDLTPSPEPAEPAGENQA